MTLDLPNAVRIVRVGPHTLILGDAYGVLPGLLAARGRPFDEAVMDPPYDFDNSGGGAFRAARHAHNALSEAGLDQGFDHRILTPALADGVVVFCHNDQLPGVLTHLDRVFARFALCCWRKTNPPPVANKHYQPDLEFYVHAWLKPAHPVGELADKRRGTMWDGACARGGEDQHPTVKPDGLMDRIMRNLSGAEVLDPFMGTGSTGVAAVKAGKTFTGIEIDPHWFDLAVRRVTAAMEGAADPIRERPRPRPSVEASAPLFEGGAA